MTGLRGRLARARAARAIRYHYDRSNAFYALFLDRRMVYTCAYWGDAGADLDRAQEEKLDLVCRKLDLRPGDRLLDVGCGWGGLVVWAAERYGAEALGITLSPAQAQWARDAIRAAGVEGRARVECRDWRDLGPDVVADKVAAVGVIEHVGIGAAPAFLAAAWRALVPGGRFLNHGITRQKGWRPTSLMRFVTTHVFPGGELHDVSGLLDATERAGFEVLHVEGLRPHYVRTTREWVARLDRNAARARALVGDRTYRLWRVYLAGASAAFAEGSIGVHQILVRKPGSDQVPAEAASARSFAQR